VPDVGVALHGEQPLVAVDGGVRAIAKHLRERGGKVLGVAGGGASKS
jgi:hypothetical protein